MYVRIFDNAACAIFHIGTAPIINLEMVFWEELISVEFFGIGAGVEELAQGFDCNLAHTGSSDLVNCNTPACLDMEAEPDRVVIKPRR